MHPISILRLESHVAVIRLKELPVGFRVISADAVSFEILPDDAKRDIRDSILSDQTNHPDKVSCAAMFYVQAIDASSRVNLAAIRLKELPNGFRVL
jgi:hypothetical protein